MAGRELSRAGFRNLLTGYLMQRKLRARLEGQMEEIMLGGTDGHIREGMRFRQLLLGG